MAHPTAAAFPDVPSGLRLVSCTGSRWPAELSNGDRMIFAPDLLLKELSIPKQGPFWLGYISPVNLLLQQQPSDAAGLEQLLHDWLEHTSIFLEALTAAPTRTRLINLSHQPPLTGEQAALSPDRLPLPLQLYLQKRGDVLERYFDLEAQADLLGRQAEFVLPFASPTSNDWKGLLLQAWEAHQAIKQLTRERDEAAAGIKEAREEGELTMVQLQQVQEELEQYFLRCRSSDQLVEAQSEQNHRAFSLIGRMLRLLTVPT